MNTPYFWVTRNDGEMCRCFWAVTFWMAVDGGMGRFANPSDVAKVVPIQ